MALGNDVRLLDGLDSIAELAMLVGMAIALGALLYGFAAGLATQQADWRRWEAARACVNGINPASNELRDASTCAWINEGVRK